MRFNFSCFSSQLFVSSVLLTALSGPMTAYSAPQKCPIAAAGETQADCPWAGLARELGEIDGLTPKQLKSSAPNLTTMISKDAKNPSLLGAWGNSVNFDANAKAEIVKKPIVEAIETLAEYKNKIGSKGAHAGLIHTYGYLLSNLKTPYGFKRARWVRPTIEDGFGLPRGTLLGSDGKSTLLANATHLFGSFAFRSEKAPLARLQQSSNDTAAAIKSIPFNSLPMRRLTESLTIETESAKKHRFELRTDIVKFLKTQQDKSDLNTHLLIYSIQDSVSKESKIITGFPVDSNFVDSLFAPKSLGEQSDLKIRYNGYVAEMMDKALKGKRAATIIMPGDLGETLLVNDSDWPPFFFAGKQGGPRGLAKEILETCMPTTGLKAQFKFYPIKRMNHNMETGVTDLNIFSFNKEREGWLFYNREALFELAYKPVVRSDSKIKITKISDFDNLRLGHLAGLTYSQEFKAYVDARQKAKKLEESDNLDSNLQKLVAGRIDIYVDGAPTVLWQLKNKKLESQVKILDYNIKRGDYFITLSKASKRLSQEKKVLFLEAMDSCIRSLKKDEYYNKKLSEYGQPLLPKVEAK